MKQSEKYEALQYAFWYTFEHENYIRIYRLKNDQKYKIGPCRLTGEEVMDIWNKLLWFRDEALNREKLEEEGGGQDE